MTALVGFVASVCQPSIFAHGSDWRRAGPRTARLLSLATAGADELALAMAVPVTGQRSGIACSDAPGIAIVAPAFVASSSQRRGQLLLDELLNVLPGSVSARLSQAERLLWR
jgi:hypothetical protein